MKIKKGKSFAIYVSSKVNDEVLNFLNSQKNVSESIISIIEDYLSRAKTENFQSLSKRVSILESKVFGNSKDIQNVDSDMNNNFVFQNTLSPNQDKKDLVDEELDDDNDMEFLFKKLNE
jgi:hypothetical protein